MNPRPLRYPPINPRCPHLLHGGDYNPDQWQEMPEILGEDIRLMKLAGCNALSVGIFAWAALEPEEGRFDFEWLDRTMDDLASAGMYAVLATPSGARPPWMAQKYPEVLRVEADRTRRLFGHRHNHCPSSPVYRSKCGRINSLLAERYGKHPALLVWHVSNEYSGHCHCGLCQEAFRDWLRKRYGTLDALNRAWWSAFWSHTFTDWSQIESPSPQGEGSLHGLKLDWRRYTTARTVDFMKTEIAPLRALTPDVPVTTNLMGFFYDLDYWKFASELDVISWDSYPEWGSPQGDVEVGSRTAFAHDLNRSLKGGRPFMLMESTPSVVNWREVAKLKRPGMHRLSSLQAVAHGSDTIQYFQWRKSRGSSEKFHGAVVDHAGHEHTRVFRDVAELGGVLAKLDEVAGTGVPAQTALVFDWENRWAMDDAQGPRKFKGYDDACHAHYHAFWKRGIPVDVINMDCDFSPYRLVVAPMLYMVRPGVAERLEAFVKAGGTLIVTYSSGIVDESDLCFLGGFPGPLRGLLGIWAEEIDALYDGETNTVVPVAGNTLGLDRSYEARELCELIHAESAGVLATYGRDFYAGRPALTENHYGQGRAYYVAARLDSNFQDDFAGALAKQLALRTPLDGKLPEGLSVHIRSDGAHDFVFLMNFLPVENAVDLGNGGLEDLIDGGTLRGTITLPGFGSKVLKRVSQK